MFKDLKTQHSKDGNSPKFIYRLNVFQQKSQTAFLVYIDKTNVYKEGKETRRDKIILKKIYEFWEITLSGFKTHYKITIIKIMWY